MKEDKLIEKSLKLIESLNSLVLTTIDSEGYPHSKSMLKLENVDLKAFYLSTNTSSKKVKYIVQNPKSSIYFYDEKRFLGLELIGKIQIINEDSIKSKLWKEGFEVYYPLGKQDPDYCILLFIPEKGNFYENLKNYDFRIK